MAFNPNVDAVLTSRPPAFEHAHGFMLHPVVHGLEVEAHHPFGFFLDCLIGELHVGVTAGIHVRGLRLSAHSWRNGIHSCECSTNGLLGDFRSECDALHCDDLNIRDADKS